MKKFAEKYAVAEKITDDVFSCQFDPRPCLKATGTAIDEIVLADVVDLYFPIDDVNDLGSIDYSYAIAVAHIGVGTFGDLVDVEFNS